MKVALGHSYEDTITGFVGVATARTEYLYGCVRVGLEGSVDDKPDEFWFDEQRLIAMPKRGELASPLRIEEPGKSKPGGPRDIPPRHGLGKVTHR